MQHLDATDSSALAYLTVYPFNGFAAVTDAQLADLLTRIKAIIASGRPVFFRYASEMNGNWFLYGQDPAGFKASWIRVYNYIKGGLGADANKIAFLWSPNSGYNYPWPGGIVYPNATNPADAARIKLLDTDGDGHLTGADNPFTPYYPGDQYVDWVGLSMYHYGTEWPWYQNVPPKSGDFEAFLTGTYMTDTGLFPFYTWFSGSGLAGITSGNKPFFVSETGAAYHYGWDPAKQPIDPAYINQLNTTAPRTPIKQSWWRQFLSPDFLSRYPRVRAICTFEFDKAEELTLRDFSNMGVAPGGQAEAADVLAALQADLAGDYGSAVAWASAGMPVRVEATSSPVASATVAPVNKTSAAAGVDAARVVERVAAVAVGLLGLALAALVA
ncbi:glycoside hydrolase superfamily [Zopfochytrium polystomum]|nr:glycoside hydrolase superfamily [Zopfochytrium polystomum]